jgi:anthranilate phosphoribosyltransferase
VDKLALTLEDLGQVSGVVGHGVITADRGIDELTTATVNQVRGVGRCRDLPMSFQGEAYGLPRTPFADLEGGDVTANLAIVEAVLAGRGPRGLVDTIVLNAAIGLLMVGRTATIREGLAPARELLLGGAVQARIAATKEFYRP